ncbi:transcription termination factor 4, mitochondrial [Phlebotomus argentipes]|uniref:transcription termination factor 4, mitochondrial n=1 Tax=Phlebotomus argentipes TaxID=94469 RepID=UPI002892D0B6|nr:transcription termination factor 4, mitochondrial [Phlebotomus argentipes]
MLIRRVFFSKFPGFPSTNRRFWSSVAAPQLIDSLTSMTDGEINANAIDQTLKLNPKLLEYDLESWRRIVSTFRNQGFPSYMLLPLIVNHPPILHRSAEQINFGLDKWNTSQFGERNIMKLITRYPDLLEISKSEKFISDRIGYLQIYAETRKNVFTMIMNSPCLITDKVHVIDSKIAYLKDTMRVDLSEVLKSEVFSKTYSKIRTRHTFLDRLGVYKQRSYKADARAISTNPKLYQIMDTSDKTFATKIAFVTLEEYEVFEELYARELREDEEFESLESDGDEE